MPGSSQSSRGIPRKSRNPARKQRHKRYWDRCTCSACGLVFRSPKRKKLHLASGHKLKPALRKLHVGTQQASMEAFEDRYKSLL